MYLSPNNQLVFLPARRLASKVCTLRHQAYSYCLHFRKLPREDAGREVKMSAVQEAEEETVIENPYIAITSPEHSKPLALSSKGPIFDDSTYAKGYQPPEVHLSPRKPSTLERGARAIKERVSSLKRKSPSSGNLLAAGSTESLDGDSGDYDDVLVGPGVAGAVLRPPVPPKPHAREK